MSTEHKETIDKLRVDIRDVFGYLDEIDRHIHWLGSSMDKRQVDLPAVPAAHNTLKRVDKELWRLGREL